MALAMDTELVETLGEGAFGTVYVARIKDGAIERTVVMKVLKDSWSENSEIVSRARDEAVMLARLNHDSIVKVEQLTTVMGRVAVVMEFVRGLTLDRVLKESGALPVGVALQIGSRVAGALDAAYNKIPPGMEQPLRVVHRDIKPSNIIVSVTGAVKVLDFGTAKGEFGTREAETQSVTLGSPRYMAPERFDGVKSGPEVDVYALGITLVELLAGRPLGRLPLNPDRHKEAVDKALSRFKTGGGGKIDELIELLKSTLAYKPSKRPSARELRVSLLDTLANLPGAGVTLDRFAESIVEPMYDARERLEPVPIEESKVPLGDVSGVSGLSAGFSGLSSISARSAASSLVLSVGGGQSVVKLALGGVLVASAILGGLLFVSSQDNEESAIEAEPVEQTVTSTTPSYSPDGVQEEQQTSGEMAEEVELDEGSVEGVVEVEEEEEAVAEVDVAPTIEAPQVVSIVEEPVIVEREEVVEVVEIDQPSPASIYFTSNPPGAVIFINRQQISTPSSVTLTEGSARAVVRFSEEDSFNCNLDLVDQTVLHFDQAERLCPDGSAGL